MNKKLIAALLLCVFMVSTLAACGNAVQESKNTTEPAAETGTVETSTAKENEPDTEETAESQPAETVEQSAESTTEETSAAMASETSGETAAAETEGESETGKDIQAELNSAEFNETQAFNKVVQMFNAKMDLFNYGSVNVDLNCLVDSETFGEYGYSGDVTGSDGKVPVTSDGVTIADSVVTMMAATQNYFRNYVNVSPEYYSLEDYFKTHTQKEILDTAGYVEGKTMGYMANGLQLLEYLYNYAESLYHGDFLIGDACTVEGTSFPEPVYYQLPLLVNDEYFGVDAIYDKDGNLMDIWSTEEADNNDDYWLNCVGEIDAYIASGQSAS